MCCKSLFAIIVLGFYANLDMALITLTLDVKRSYVTKILAA